MTEFSYLLITLLLGALFGGITAFTVMFAPLIFVKLPADIAGRFVRAVFPWYYLYLIVSSAVACVLLFLSSHLWLGLVSLLVAGVGVYARTVLMPLINELRDAELAGDMDAGEQFKVQHRFSVIVNVVQWVLAAYLLWAWASPAIEKATGQ
ncbi:MAG: DUF4149 domain-containing protein [Limnobacter sp.]|nr:DUF4149 domain-containing protein [Limnobacter sp.]